MPIVPSPELTSPSASPDGSPQPDAATAPWGAPIVQEAVAPPVVVATLGALPLQRSADARARRSAPAVQRSLLDTGLDALRQSAPAVRSQPSPAIPAMSTGLPGMPTIPVGGMPRLPDLPTANAPGATGAPTMPSLQSTPGRPAPPDLPSPSTLPRGADDFVVPATMPALPAPPGLGAPSAPRLPLPVAQAMPAASALPDSTALQAMPQTPSDAPASSPPSAQEPPTPAPSPQPTADGHGAASAMSAAEVDDLARRLTTPLLRRLRAQLLLDRERLGVRTDV
jgi:hypothetical protein